MYVGKNKPGKFPPYIFLPDLWFKVVSQYFQVKVVLASMNSIIFSIGLREKNIEFLALLMTGFKK